MCIAITQYTKTKNHNTNYYRRNKAERFNVLSCPHCNYETTGPKSALQAHIWSKHTPENERPFQCPCSGCHRGFSARANLNKHILKQHNIKMPKKINKDVLIYRVSLQQQKKICKDSLIRRRIVYYKKNPIIKAEELPFNYNDIEFSLSTLFYDQGMGLIEITPYNRKELLNLYN